MIKQHKLDISKIPGTGKDGRVTKEDVIIFMEKGESKENVNTKSKPVSEPKEISNQSIPKPSKQFVPGEIITHKMTDFQKGMQKSMTVSNSIPQFQLVDEIEISKLVNGSYLKI